MSTAFAQGPTVVQGRMEYQNYIIPKYFAGGATVGLISVADAVVQNTGRFASKSDQILGYPTSPIVKSPFTFEIRLPIEPAGTYVDVDFDGKADRGVQIYKAVVATNLFGDGYLEQLEQVSGFGSILTEGRTGRVRRGTLLIYAADDRQQAPCGAGKDGRLFTQDDVVAPLPKGYTLMEIGEDGSVAHRHDAFRMDLLEEAAVETPDFSGQGILRSYRSLADLLAERYAYTEYRRVDWTAMRSRFEPRAVELDKSGDKEGFADLLRELAFSLEDGHVNAVVPYSLKTAWLTRLGDLWSGNAGATVQKFSDGRFCVTAVRPDSPAAKAGWTPGTEIVAVGGKTVERRLAEVPLIASAGTRERIEAMRLPRLLSFPQGTIFEASYKLPNDPEVRTAKMEAQPGEVPAYASFPRDASQPFGTTYLEDGAIGYAQWRSFENVALNMAEWEHFLAGMVGRPAMILDLRGNGGGLETLYFTMASYLFTQDRPAKVKWTDRYEFDSSTKRFEKSGTDVSPVIFAPRPELAYPGKVIVLVDSGTASAAEFFSQYLQRLGRARIVAEMGTDGAGGSMRQVVMPYGIIFTYTGGQTFFVGTKDPNIEGKGVTPDVRVPVTLANEQAKFAGRDVVLEEAIRILKSELPQAPGG